MAATTPSRTSASVASMFGFDRQQLANIEQAVGPTIAENRREERGAWWHQGRLYGQPVWLGLDTRGAITGIDFAAPLCGRPIQLSISDRRTTTAWGTAELLTGDSRFDTTFLVTGWPAEVLHAALDEPTRRWLLSTFPRRDPQISTEFGRVQIHRSLATASGSLGVSGDQAMPPAELAYWMESMTRLAAGLVTAFDQIHARIAREHGPAAAHAWIQAQVAEFAALERARASFRVRTGVGVLLFTLVLLVVIAVVVTQF
jgi:hypothetical protein